MAIRKVIVFFIMTAGFWGCGSSKKEQNAILILLDTLRADRLSCYGYPVSTTPRMDQLAQRGVVFLNHYSQGTHTLREIPNIFYSRYFFRPLFPGNPDIPFYNPRDLIRIDDPESISLPRVLSGAGYWTCIISAHAWIKPNTPFAQQFDESHDLSTELQYPEERAYPDAKQVVDYAIEWIQRQQHRNFFLYLHFMDLHFPHYFDQDAKDILTEQGFPVSRPERFAENGWTKEVAAPLLREEKAYLNALYDGNLRFADRHLGRLFDSLGNSIDNTLIAVASDHGEELLEVPGRFGHGGKWYEPVAHVPFIVSFPTKLEEQSATFFSENVDIMPTLLGLLDVSLPTGKKTDGMNLIPILEGEGKPRTSAVMLRGIRNDRYKCVIEADSDSVIFQGDENLTTSGKLYDLKLDPFEQKNIWDENPEIVAKMLQQYRGRLHHSLLRFEAAISQEQPEGQFAISAKVFKFQIPEKDVELSKYLRKIGWEEYSKRQRGQAYVLASPGAEPLQITFSIPNGIYSVSVVGLGAGKITFPSDQVDIRTDEIPDREKLLKAESQKMSLGIRRISTTAFNATLTPDTGSPLLVRYFEFIPIDTGGNEIPEMDENTREQLKALGYVE